MEFWGVEVKPGQTLDCDPGEDKYIHLSQLAVGENFKDTERVSVYVHFEGKKIMLGTFTRGICDQIGLDLVFEKKFQISHTSKGTTVFCSGYTTFIQDEEDGYPSYSDSEDEEEMMKAVFPTKENGGKLLPTEAKEAKQAGTKPGKPAKGSDGKPQVAKLPSKKADKDEEDSDDDEEDEDSEEDVAMEDASESDEDDEDDDDSDSDEEEEETPKVKDGKKRVAPNSATKTPGTDKKAKLATPEGQKQGDAKKNVHVATPHPGKQGVKKGKYTPETSKPQTAAKETPKSNSTPGSGKKLLQFTCPTCQRSFHSESGLSSHTAAKHGGK